MEIGKRKLINDLVLRGSFSVGIIRKGKIIQITQIDNKNKKALVENQWVRMDYLEKISKSL